MLRGKNIRPSFPPSIFPSIPIPLPPCSRHRDCCMTMAKTLKPDFGCHYSRASLVVQRLKASACNVGDLVSIPGSGRSPGEGSGNPLQYSCLENSMDGGAGWAIICGSQRVGHDWATSLSLHFHTSVRKVPCDLNVTHWAPSLHHIPCFTHIVSVKVLCKPSSTIPTTVWRYCESLICADENFTL